MPEEGESGPDAPLCSRENRVSPKNQAVGAHLPDRSCAIVASDRLWRELLELGVTVRAGLQVLLSTGLPVADGLFTVHRPDILLLVSGVADPMALAAIREFFTGSPRGHCIVLAPGPADPKALGRPKTARLQIIDSRKPLVALWSELGIDGPSSPASQAADQPGTLLGKPLTNREGQVFMLVGNGLTNSEIAGRLKLSVHTVRAHRKRIAGKLGVDGGEAARRAILMDRGRRGPS